VLTCHGGKRLGAGREGRGTGSHWVTNAHGEAMTVRSQRWTHLSLKKKKKRNRKEGKRYNFRDENRVVSEEGLLDNFKVGGRPQRRKRRGKAERTAREREGKEPQRGNGEDISKNSKRRFFSGRSSLLVKTNGKWATIKTTQCTRCWGVTKPKHRRISVYAWFLLGV